MACIGTILIGCGIALNNQANLGNDPVAIVYDGIKAVAGLSDSQLGIVVNLINWIMVGIVYWINKRYINIGTFMYIFPLGLIIDISTKLIQYYLPVHSILSEIIMAIIGFNLLFCGIGIYIAIDIGVDPISGIVLILKDKFQMPYRYIKMIFDTLCVGLGIALGGKFGVVTLCAAFGAGIVISIYTSLTQKYLQWRKDSKEEIKSSYTSYGDSP